MTLDYLSEEDAFPESYDMDNILGAPGIFYWSLMKDEIHINVFSSKAIFVFPEIWIQANTLIEILFSFET